MEIPLLMLSYLLGFFLRNTTNAAALTMEPVTATPVIMVPAPPSFFSSEFSLVSESLELIGAITTLSDFGVSVTVLFPLIIVVLISASFSVVTLVLALVLALVLTPVAVAVLLLATVLTGVLTGVGTFFSVTVLSFLVSGGDTLPKLIFINKND